MRKPRDMTELMIECRYPGTKFHELCGVKTVKTPTLSLVLKTLIAHAHCNSQRLEMQQNQNPSRSPSIESYQTEELVSSFLSLFYATQYATRNCSSTCLLYTSHDHTEMTRFHDYCYSLWLEDLHYRVGDVFCKPFLNL